MMDHHDILLTGGSGATLTHRKTWVSFGFVASFHKTAGPNTVVVIQCERREWKFRGGREGKQITQIYILFRLSVNTNHVCLSDNKTKAFGNMKTVTVATGSLR